MSYVEFRLVLNSRDNSSIRYSIKLRGHQSHNYYSYKTNTG